jgi:stage II sporulation protein D
MFLLAVITVKIGVFGLFHPTQLHVEAPPPHVLVLNGTPCTSADIRRNDPPVHITARDGGAADFVLSVPGKIKREFHGTLDITSVNGELIPVITMDREQAVAAVLAAEYPDGTGIEALKAAAVLARSYYASSPKRHADFDFCDTTHCQFHRWPPPQDHPAWRAAQQTEGLTLLYQNRTFAPLYSASCGGRTHTTAEVGLQSDPYPYFAVDCSTCQRNTRTWTQRLEGEPSRTEQFRLAKKIPSNNYSVEKANGVITLRGRGEGHGVGLCQRGASAMAATGASFRDILNHYYPNTICSRSSPPLR